MLHLHTQSDGATGGVYKGQGRIQHELITHAYKTLPVKDQKFQGSIPTTMQTLCFPCHFLYGNLIICIIVARERPRTSKGITDLLLPPTSIASLSGNRLSKKPHT